MYTTNTKLRPFLNRSYTSFLRGVCMLMIVFSHTANEFKDTLANYNIDSLLLCGQFATGLFLFLSGYGLTLSIKRNKIDHNYISKHFRRLFYPYFIFWLFYIIVGLLHGGFRNDNDLLLEFLFLKMPNTDTWFFRTILVIYVLYFSLAKISKPNASIYMAIVIVIYTIILICYEVPSWWWNTICCFPVGILFANTPKLCTQIPIAGLFILGILFVILYKYPPTVYIGAISTPIIFCLCCAYLSPKIIMPENIPVISYIGTNSLYMYFMETIPIDYFAANKTGFTMFVFGGILVTIALTYLGKFTETHILRHQAA